MFYDRFVQLCSQKGISPSRAAIDAGISKSLVTKWKANGCKDPSPDVLRKLASYFCVTVSELLDEEKTPTPKGERDVENERILNAIDATDPATREVVLRLLGLQ